MGVYLVDHPPRTQQFRCPRRERPSGVIGVHTAESFPDETGPDTGAENVAAFIARRTNYGSYHLLADSDSVIQLIEFRCVAYHIGTHSLNEHSIGVSAATQAHRWGSLDDFWVRACVTNMARASALAAQWLQDEHGITVPARRITLTQARDKVPGFIAHADADPARRTDPGKTFPWEMFLDTYARLMAGEEDDMTRDEFREWFGEIVDEAARGLSGDDRDSTKYGRNVRDDIWRIVRDPIVATVRANAGGDPADIATALAPLVIPPVVAAVGAAGGLTAEQVEEAAEKALRDVLGSLDE